MGKAFKVTVLFPVVLLTVVLIPAWIRQDDAGNAGAVLYNAVSMSRALDLLLDPLVGYLSMLAVLEVQQRRAAGRAQRTWTSAAYSAATLVSGVTLGVLLARGRLLLSDDAPARGMIIRVTAGACYVAFVAAASVLHTAHHAWAVGAGVGVGVGIGLSSLEDGLTEGRNQPQLTRRRSGSGKGSSVSTNNTADRAIVPIGAGTADMDPAAPSASSSSAVKTTAAERFLQSSRNMAAAVTAEEDQGPGDETRPPAIAARTWSAGAGSSRLSNRLPPAPSTSAAAVKATRAGVGGSSRFNDRILQWTFSQAAAGRAALLLLVVSVAMLLPARINYSDDTQAGGGRDRNCDVSHCVNADYMAAAGTGSVAVTGFSVPPGSGLLCAHSRLRAGLSDEDAFPLITLFNTSYWAATYGPSSGSGGFQYGGAAFTDPGQLYVPEHCAATHSAEIHKIFPYCRCVLGCNQACAYSSRAEGWAAVGTVFAVLLGVGLAFRWLQRTLYWCCCCFLCGDGDGGGEGAVGPDLDKERDRERDMGSGSGAKTGGEGTGTGPTAAVWRSGGSGIGMTLMSSTLARAADTLLPRCPAMLPGFAAGVLRSSSAIWWQAVRAPYASLSMTLASMADNRLMFAALRLWLCDLPAPLLFVGLAQFVASVVLLAPATDQLSATSVTAGTLQAMGLGAGTVYGSAAVGVVTLGGDPTCANLLSAFDASGQSAVDAAAGPLSLALHYTPFSVYARNSSNTTAAGSVGVGGSEVPADHFASMASSWQCHDDLLAALLVLGYVLGAAGGMLLLRWVMRRPVRQSRARGSGRDSSGSKAGRLLCALMGCVSTAVRPDATPSPDVSPSKRNEGGGGDEGEDEWALLLAEIRRVAADTGERLAAAFGVLPASMQRSASTLSAACNGRVEQVTLSAWLSVATAASCLAFYIFLSVTGVSAGGESGMGLRRRVAWSFALSMLCGLPVGGKLLLLYGQLLSDVVAYDSFLQDLPYFPLNAKPAGAVTRGAGAGAGAAGRDRTNSSGSGGGGGGGTSGGIGRSASFTSEADSGQRDDSHLPRNCSSSGRVGLYTVLFAVLLPKLLTLPCYWAVRAGLYQLGYTTVPDTTTASAAAAASAAQSTAATLESFVLLVTFLPPVLLSAMSLLQAVHYPLFFNRQRDLLHHYLGSFGSGSAASALGGALALPSRRPPACYFDPLTGLPLRVVAARSLVAGAAERGLLRGTSERSLDGGRRRGSTDLETGGSRLWSRIVPRVPSLRSLGVGSPEGSGKGQGKSKGPRRNSGGSALLASVRQLQAAGDSDLESDAGRVDDESFSHSHSNTGRDSPTAPSPGALRAVRHRTTSDVSMGSSSAALLASSSASTAVCVEQQFYSAAEWGAVKLLDPFRSVMHFEFMLKCVEADCGEYVVEYGQMQAQNRAVYGLALVAASVAGMVLCGLYLNRARSLYSSEEAGRLDMYGADGSWFILPMLSVTCFGAGLLWCSLCVSDYVLVTGLASTRRRIYGPAAKAENKARVAEGTGSGRWWGEELWAAAVGAVTMLAAFVRAVGALLVGKRGSRRRPKRRRQGANDGSNVAEVPEEDEEDDEEQQRGSGTSSDDGEGDSDSDSNSVNDSADGDAVLLDAPLVNSVTVELLQRLLLLRQLRYVLLEMPTLGPGQAAHLRTMVLRGGLLGGDVNAELSSAAPTPDGTPRVSGAGVGGKMTPVTAVSQSQGRQDVKPPVDLQLPAEKSFVSSAKQQRLQQQQVAGVRDLYDDPSDPSDDGDGDSEGSLSYRDEEEEQEQLRKRQGQGPEPGTLQQRGEEQLDRLERAVAADPASDPVLEQTRQLLLASQPSVRGWGQREEEEEDDGESDIDVEGDPSFKEGEQEGEEHAYSDVEEDDDDDESRADTDSTAEAAGPDRGTPAGVAEAVARGAPLAVEDAKAELRRLREAKSSLSRQQEMADRTRARRELRAQQKAAKKEAKKEAKKAAKMAARETAAMSGKATS